MKVFTDCQPGHLIVEYMRQVGIDYNFIPSYGKEKEIDVLNYLLDNHPDEKIVMILDYEMWFKLLFENSTQSLKKFLSRFTPVLYAAGRTEDNVHVLSEYCNEGVPRLGMSPSDIKIVNDRTPKDTIAVVHGKVGQFIPSVMTNMKFMAMAPHLFWLREDLYAKFHLNHHIDRTIGQDKDFFFIVNREHKRYGGLHRFPIREKILPMIFDDKFLTMRYLSICNSGNKRFSVDDIIDLYPGQLIEQIVNDYGKYFLVHLPNYDFYNRTNFELVFESRPWTANPLDDSCMLNEKVWRPITMKHPFLVVGATGTWKTLRELGFEDFSRLIDHSYDEETDQETRVTMIVENIKKIITDGSENFYNGTKDIREHNFQNLSRLIGNVRNDSFHDGKKIFKEIEKKL